MNSDRIEKEKIAYDNIALDMMEASDMPTIVNDLVGENLVARFRAGGDLGRFPRPFPLWVNSLQDPISHIATYDWMRPIEDRRFVSIGGNGSQAIKMLMAGAEQAVLVTPSWQEGRLARKMAKFLGLDNRFDVIMGVGEQLPFAAGSVDRILGSGTLHHMDIKDAIPEIARVLAPGGLAAFAEPRLNFLYRLFENTRIRQMVREPGAQCYPLRISDILENSADYFRVSRYKLSGGLIRYGIVVWTRGFKFKMHFALSLWSQAAETRILQMLGLSSILGGVAFLLAK